MKPENLHIRDQVKNLSQSLNLLLLSCLLAPSLAAWTYIFDHGPRHASLSPATSPPLPLCWPPPVSLSRLALLLTTTGRHAHHSMRRLEHRHLSSCCLTNTFFPPFWIVFSVPTYIAPLSQPIRVLLRRRRAAPLPTYECRPLPLLATTLCHALLSFLLYLLECAGQKQKMGKRNSEREEKKKKKQKGGKGEGNLR